MVSHSWSDNHELCMFEVLFPMVFFQIKEMRSMCGMDYFPLEMNENYIVLCGQLVNQRTSMKSLVSG